MTTNEVQPTHDAGVYLLHFSPPYRHAKHYLGYGEDIARRVTEHQAGHGARLTQVAYDAGCDLVLARTWPGADRTFERTLKNRKMAPRLCPICRQAHEGQMHQFDALDFTLDDVSELEF